MVRFHKRVLGSCGRCTPLRRAVVLPEQELRPLAGGDPEDPAVALVQVEGQQLVEGEGLATQGAGGVGQVLMLQGQVTAQVVPTQAFLWTQVAVVDGLNLEGMCQDRREADRGRNNFMVVEL